jgi:NAD(P)-dependent dehydrogenase (short-subunit alcohol dehydrogenase family)
MFCGNFYLRRNLFKVCEGGIAMEISFKGKTAVVTGASEGIGYAAAELFGKLGANVAICARNIDKLENAKAQLEKQGIKVYIQSVDVAKMDQLMDFADNVEKEFGRIDIIVNNAGYMPFTLLKDTSEQMWDTVIDTNLKSVFVGGKIAYEKMKDNGGVVINASSFASVIPSVGYTAYAAAKAGVSSLTKTMASELAPYKIRVLGYIPGLIDTALTKESQKMNGDKLLEPISMRRFGTPEDVAKVIVFMASDLAGYMSGTCVEITGGKFATQNPMKAWNI